MTLDCLLEPIGTGLGIWVSTRIEEDTDHTCKQPNGIGRAVKLLTNVLVSLMIVVSHGDDFTPFHVRNLLRSLFPETNETVNCLAISKKRSKLTYESRETGGNTWERTIIQLRSQCSSVLDKESEHIWSPGLLSLVPSCSERFFQSSLRR